jgi:hypothetical protein
MKLKIILFIILLAVTFSVSRATHITHGNIYYEYLGKDGSNNLKYKVDIILYRDCAGSQVSFDDAITIGIYQATTNNPLLKKHTVTKSKEFAAEPMYVGVNKANICVRKAVYSILVNVPASTSGYYFVWQRCCRALSTNIVDDNSSSYMAFVPGDENNIAQPFTDVLFATGSNTTVNLPMGSYDADGDSLTYELTDILRGDLDELVPIWEPPTSLPFPAKRAQYRNGFTGINPLGIYGTTTLSAQTGILRVNASKQGRYYIGVKVSEWRNGALLTEYIREYIVVFLGGVNNNSLSLIADGSEKKEISLGWGIVGDSTKVGNIDSFTVERKNSGSTSWQYIAIVTGSIFGYFDGSIKYDTVYDYQVTAHINGSSTVVSNTDAAVVYSGRTNSIHKLEAVYTIYPNPVASKLFITADVPVLEVQIFDLQGKMVLRQQLDGQLVHHEINTNKMAEGIYMLRIVGKSIISNYKIIKQ